MGKDFVYLCEIYFMTNSRARETTEAIERLYISMRHLFYRGFFKPGVFQEKVSEVC